MLNAKVRSSAVLAAVTLAASCSKPAGNPAPQAAAPAAAPPAQAAPAQAAPAQVAPAQAAAAPAGAVIASETFSGDSNLRCDLLEVKRVSGGAVRVKWRMVNTGSKRVQYNFSWEDLYLVDPAENKRYGFLTDSEGQRILDIFEGQFDVGVQKVQWAKFPEPPATSTKLTVTIPKVTPFEDVPLSR